MDDAGLQRGSGGKALDERVRIDAEPTKPIHHAADVPVTGTLVLPGRPRAVPGLAELEHPGTIVPTTGPGEVSER